MAAPAGEPARFADVTRWLFAEARFVPTLEAIFGSLIERLEAAGLPLLRAGLHVNLLHPQLVAVSFHGWAGGAVQRVERPRYAGWESAGYGDSPLAVVNRDAVPLRRRLVGPDAARDFPILADLAAGGGTDYYVQPLVFSDRRVGAVISWCTSRPGGFSDADLAALDELTVALSTFCELRVLHGLARILLDTYIGRTAGQRVLAGTIERGRGELLHAVVWCCDLRGFTQIAETQPPDAVVTLLNGWFERTAGAVQAEGGEVLKFIGDGMLAIFPIQPGESPARACRSALAAVRRAEGLLGAFAAETRAATGISVDWGVALHVGEVTYGNIGAPDRLDFTVIGPAVNQAARVEALCRALGRRALATAAVAEHLPDAVEPLGRFVLRGIEESQEIWGFR